MLQQNDCEAPDTKIPISSPAKRIRDRLMGRVDRRQKKSTSNLMDERFKLSSCSIFLGDIFSLPFGNKTM